MQYRSLGSRIEEEVSALGFGCMRLPTLGSPEKIDTVLAKRLLLSTIDEGLNYVDTAYPYHGGASEVFVGEALEGAYRKKVLLATKLPVWSAEVPEDFDRILEEQLKRLKTEHVDVYLLHGLDQERWDRVRSLGVQEWMLRKRSEGKIRYIGFSFHGPLREFTSIVDGWDAWDVCLVQYNFMNVTHQAGTSGVRYAAARGIGVAVMEPLLGGALANPPESVKRIWLEAAADRTAAEWALRWLWNQEEVGTVLSGMNCLRDVEENLLFAERNTIRSITASERLLYERVRRKYDETRSIPCTACEYCLPCPNGIDIPGNFSIYNTALFQKQLWIGQADYRRKKLAERAGACLECGECTLKCPQTIPIPDRLKEVHRALSET